MYPPAPFPFHVWRHSLSFVCFETKVGSIDILLLLRTDMSEWSVWVTMPEVQRASKYTTDSLVSVSASVFVPAVALYFCLRVVCISVHAPGLFPLLPNCSLLSPICTLSLLLSNHISSPFGISLAFHAGIFPSTLPNSSLVGSKRKFSTLLLLKVTSSIDNCLLNRNGRLMPTCCIRLYLHYVRGE